MTRRDDIQKLMNTYKRRLEGLKQQEALFGPNADPAVRIQIEDIEAELKKLKAELAELEEAEQWTPPTPPPSPPAPRPEPARPPVVGPGPFYPSSLWVLAGGGVLFVIIITLVLSTFLTNNGPSSPTPAALATIPPTPPPIVTLTPTQHLTPTPSEPRFEEIIFAQGYDPDKFEPINPADCFSPSLTEIHAIFKYDGLSQNDHWERVWYVNNQEVSRSSGQWALEPRGIFDAFLENDDNSFPTGEWRFELYINDELSQEGRFTIKSGC